MSGVALLSDERNGAILSDRQARCNCLLEPHMGPWSKRLGPRPCALALK